MDNGRHQSLYESAYTRVLRVHGPDGLPSRIRKERLGPTATKRVRHETAILERLAGIDGIPRLLGVAAGIDAFTLADDGGTALADLPSATRPTMPGLLDLAVGVSQIIAAVHRRGVIHKDINPANIVICGTDSSPMLIDFDLATTVTEERPGFVHQSELVGTLAYLAPEQTGRTGRPVDQRADLYAWGATLYELITGRPPFTADDPLTLIYEHLARIPEPLTQFNPAVPRALSDIVLRLLEKEPDHRYQSADGVAHDLSRLRDMLREGCATPFPLGSRDFAPRLAPPSRLIGRDAEIEALRKVFVDAAEGRGRGVLVAGGPGVGKTALIDELRPIVTAGGGWFVTGKFDQYRTDAAADGVNQALGALGRLLLAEPEEQLAPLRTRILRALGPNAPLIARLAEFSLLLGIAPWVMRGDPKQVEARAQRAFLDLLGAVSSRTRPVVLVFDDLQWAGSFPLGLIDAALTDPALVGVLVVGAFREAEVTEVHPLSTMLARWQQLGAVPSIIRLTNLPQADLGSLLGQMLRLPGADAMALADVVGARTRGNPYDTIELVNALRKDGALVANKCGWRWNAETIRRYTGPGDVVELLLSRIGALPDPTRNLLAVMACLGGEVDLALLGAAAERDVEDVEDSLVPALEDGLVTAVRRAGSDSAVRFRHDRVQQAAHVSVPPARQTALHLEIARRLAVSGRFAVVAAQQYLPARESIDEPEERLRVAELFRGAAANLRLTSDATGERLLSAALDLLVPLGDTADARLLRDLAIDRHRALYSLGRLADMDAAYTQICRRCADPLDLVHPTAVQIAGLTCRDRQADAIALGLGLLARLGLDTTGDTGRSVAEQRDAVCDWVSRLDQDRDLQRPETADPRVLGTAELINCTLYPAFFSVARPDVWPGLVLGAQRLWDERGPCAPLLANLGLLPAMLLSVRQDRQTAYTTARHVLTVGEARGYEPATALARAAFANASAHWFEPLETCVDHAERARGDLLHGGEIQQACHTYVGSSAALLDCAATLDLCDANVQSGLTFAAHTGNNHASGMLLPYRQLIRALRGETASRGDFSDATFTPTAHLDAFAGDPMVLATYHIHRALAAALFGDQERLSEHTAAAMPLLGRLPGFYSTVLARTLRALALAERMRAAPPGARAALCADLDTCHGWLSARAADAPGNFLHLVHWISAERAHALGDPLATLTAFDLALRQVTTRRRPWHRALITERAALAHLGQGLEHTGRVLLAEAHSVYHLWGASAKVEQMLIKHPFLRSQDRGQIGQPSQIGQIEARQSPVADWRTVTQRDSSEGVSAAQVAGRRSAVPRTIMSMSTAALDLMAVLDASRVLSSETNLDRLREQVVTVLSAMTGATSVRILLWDGETCTWRLPEPRGSARSSISVEEAGQRGEVPLSPFRYAERTRQPLLVEDATHDDRFSRDPYLAGLDTCSLLVVPILAQGTPRAMLLLENRLGRHAFSTDRLDAILLIAGQLAVSLDNALVYASLERKVAERTEELNAANRRLASLSITDPLTGLANRRRLADVLESEWLRAAVDRWLDRRHHDRCRLFQAVQRPLRASGWRRVSPAHRLDVDPVRAQHRPGGPLRRRGVRRHPARCHPHHDPPARRSDPDRGRGTRPAARDSAGQDRHGQRRHRGATRQSRATCRAAHRDRGRSVVHRETQRQKPGCRRLTRVIHSRVRPDRSGSARHPHWSPRP